MKRILVAIAACLPLAAAAGSPGAGPGAGPGAESWEQRSAKMMKRARVAFAVGYAEALDLSEVEALKARDVVARFDDRRAAIHKQVREQVQVVRKAAQGDGAAGKALDGALQKLRELRGQMTAMHQEMFQALTQGLPPEKKAKAAIFIHRFRSRMARGMGEARERVIELRQRIRGPGGPGGPGGMGGPGPEGGPGMGGGPRMGFGGMSFRPEGSEDLPDIDIVPDDGNI